MKIVYFGKKYPKKIHTVLPGNLRVAKEIDKRKRTGISYIPFEGKAHTYNFEPFKALEVEDAVADFLLKNAGDIFKIVKGDPDPVVKPVVATDGYVGAVPAEKIPDLEKQVKADIKSEKGKSIEEVIDLSKSKK